MKVVHLIFCIAFVLFAALQYNDPDPYIWIPLYIYAAVICWLGFRDKFYPAASIAGIWVYIGYAVYLFFIKDGVLAWIEEHDAENIAASMQAARPWIEYAREFLGLLIVILALGVNYFYGRRRRRRAR